MSTPRQRAGGGLPNDRDRKRHLLFRFAAEMLGGLARKDQRAAGELYVRGLLTDGRRKCMQPMAAQRAQIVSGCSS